jgi:hypothetical protein
MADDGVSLAELDGTIASLGVLWQWYVPFAQTGFPGIPDDAVPRADSVEPVEPGHLRSGFASELVVHYLFRVAQTCFPAASWRLVDAPGMDSHQRTVVGYQNDEGGMGRAALEEFARNATGLLLLGEAEFLDPRFLEKVFLEGPFLCGPATAARCRAIPRGDSVLAGLVGEEVPVDSPFTIGPETGEQARDERLDEDTVGDELVLAHMTADVEALEQAPPIDVALVTQALASLDFRDVKGELPTSDAILAEEFAEFVRADDAIVTTLVAGGQLRALQVASISPSAIAWAEITEQLAQIASRIGGRLAPEDEF